MNRDAAVRRLNQHRDRLRASLAALDEGALEEDTQQQWQSDLASYDQHPADAGTETFERERIGSTREQIEARLADVERAFERLDDGSYGVCEACDAPIPDERLDAQPAARLCAADQEHAERDVGAAGRPS